MIYLLEDDDSIRKLVVYALKSQGYDAEGFDKPSAFWAALHQAVPELLLLDIMLPEEDGLSVLRKLREKRATAQIPVIMLSSRENGLPVYAIMPNTAAPPRSTSPDSSISTANA
jgi:two-component system alkaline phosphatase synthesis response regulator PhoP